MIREIELESIWLHSSNGQFLTADVDYRVDIQGQWLYGRIVLPFTGIIDPKAIEQEIRDLINKEMKCVCCNVEVNRLYPDEYPTANPWEGMWNDGIVQRIEAGYGSLLDGDMFVMAICDTCADKKTREGVMLWVGNYMFREEKTFTGLINGKKEGKEQQESGRAESQDKDSLE